MDVSMSSQPKRLPLRVRLSSFRPFRWLAWVLSPMRAVGRLSPPSNLNLEHSARKSVRDYLAHLHSSGQPMTTMSYEEAVRRADYAKSFVQHPYWEIVSRMLSGTIQAETEQLLAGGGHIAVNRASDTLG